MNDKNSCEFPDQNPPDIAIQNILSTYKTVAIVGLSDKPERDSYRVAKYLIENGFHIIPVNPMKDEILGEKSYPDLNSIPEPVEIVDVFRKVDAIPGIVDEAIAVGAKVVWLQLGLAHHESAEKARNAGLEVVQSKCIKVEHKKLFGE